MTSFSSWSSSGSAVSGYASTSTGTPNLIQIGQSFSGWTTFGRTKKY